MQSPVRVLSLPRGRALALLVAVLFPCVPSAVEAQGGVHVLDPGTRVRVRLAGAKSDVVANILEARRDTLVLVRPSAAIESRLPMPLARIQRLEVSAGRHRLTLIGGLLGGLTGAALVGVYNSITQSQCFGDCPEPASFLVGAGVGLAAGGIGFHFVQKDRWVEVSLPAPGGSRGMALRENRAARPARPLHRVHACHTGIATPPDSSRCASGRR